MHLCEDSGDYSGADVRHVQRSLPGVQSVRSGIVQSSGDCGASGRPVRGRVGDAAAGGAGRQRERFYDSVQDSVPGQSFGKRDDSFAGNQLLSLRAAQRDFSRRLYVD